MLLENKADLLSEDERNDDTALNNFSQKNNFDGSFKTSAKTGFNVDKAMDFFIGTILQRMEHLFQSNQEKNVFKTGRNVVELKAQYQVSQQIKPKNDNCC